MAAIAFYVKLPIDIDTDPQFLDAKEDCGFVGAVWPTILRIGRERNRQGTIEADALSAKTVCRRIPLPAEYRQNVQDSIDAFLRAGMLLRVGDNFTIGKWWELYGDSRSKSKPDDCKQLSALRTIDSNAGHCTQSQAMHAIDSNADDLTQCRARVDQSRADQSKAEEEADQSIQPSADPAPAGQLALVPENEESKPKKRKQPNDEMHRAVIDAYNETVRSMSSRFRPIECMSPSEQTLRKIDAAAKRVGPEFLTRWQRLCRWLPQDEHVSGRRRPPEGEDHWNWRADITFLLRPEKWERMDFLAREWTEQETRRLAEAEMQRKAREQRDAEYEQERQRERSAKPSLSERLAAVGINRDDYRSNYALIEELARREAAAKGATA